MGRVKITNNIVDIHLKDRNIERVDNVITLNTRIGWKCTICSFEWSTTPYSVVFSKKPTGCKVCANRQPLSNDLVDKRLVGRKIQRVDNIVNSITKIHWKCNICEYVWRTTPNMVLNTKTCCPKCANNLLLTNQVVDERLCGRNIKRLSAVINSAAKIKWQCTLCEYKWVASADKVLNSSTGCIKCNIHFSKPETQWLNFQKVPNTSQYRQHCIILNNKKYRVDGFIPETNTVYEFWGDYWHGNPRIFNKDEIHPVTKTTYGQLYDKTQTKRKAILDAGFNLIEIWESEWNMLKRTSA